MNTHNTPSSLDLYSKVEDLLGVKDVADDLYAYYLLALKGISFDSLLDVGCGNGDFIRKLSAPFGEVKFKGIDLSPHMVEQAKEQGVDAECIDLCDLNDSFGVVTAVFDMINYLDPASLDRFGKCLRKRLNDDGYFLCDINTLHGFRDIAVGSFSAEDANRFVAIESDFEDGVYWSDFTLFEKSDGCWHKSNETIHQYHYTPKELEEALGLKLLSRDPVSLYSDEADKEFLVFGR